jgi:hypothetical protein
MMDLGKYSEPLTESEFIKMFKYGSSVLNVPAVFTSKLAL